MKKILMIIMIVFLCGLSGCQQNTSQDEVKLIKVANEVIEQYDYDFSKNDGKGIYTIENKNFIYIVFENMNIDPDKVKLEQDGSVSTIYISFDKTDNLNTRYVYKYINHLDDEDKTLIVSDGKKEYPFDGSFIVD